MEKDIKLRKFIATTIREYLNEQKETVFKVTPTQLNKYPDINVGFTF